MTVLCPKQDQLPAEKWENKKGQSWRGGESVLLPPAPQDSHDNQLEVLVGAEV